MQHLNLRGELRWVGTVLILESFHEIIAFKQFSKLNKLPSSWAKFLILVIHYDYFHTLWKTSNVMKTCFMHLQNEEADQLC